jgi:hypothetical protein
MRCSLPGRLSVQIPEYELQDLFREFRIFDRLRSGALTEVIRERIDPAKKWCSMNGESYYSRVVEAEDESVEVARIHYIRCGFGPVIAVWPSHIIIDGVLLHRQGHQRRPVDRG